MSSAFPSVVSKIIFFFLLSYCTILWGQAPIKFINQDTSAPRNSFEACVGSRISFEYDSLSKHPNKVKLNSNLGNAIFVAVDTSNTSKTGTAFSGTVSLTLPDNAVSGKVYFFNNNSLLDSTSYPVIIHNPIVDFLPQTTPLCATDTSISLYGIPSGGTFRADPAKTDSTFINGSTINPTHAKWDTKHMDSLIVHVTYSYTPKYSNGQTCASSKDTTKAITIYDNRLDRIEFKTLLRQQADTSNQFLSLDTTKSSMITDLSHNIFCNSPSICYPNSFYGAFVTPSDSFLSPLAGASTPVRLEFNNKGCIGSATGIINIVDTIIPPSILGLPDTLCKDATSIQLKRDPQLVYSIETIGNALTGRIITRDSLIGITTSITSHSNAISHPASQTVGQESYTFNPSRLPNGTTEVILTMEYHTINRPRSSFGSPTKIDILKVRDTVIITTNITQTLSVGNFQVNHTYCFNADTITLIPSLLNAIGAQRNTLFVTYSSQNNIDRIFLPNNIFIPSFLYDSLNPTNTSSSNNLPLNLLYSIDYYGCKKSRNLSFNITPPLNPSFTNSSYCANDTSIVLRRPTLPTNTTEHFAPISGLLDTTGKITPSDSNVGKHPVTYTLTRSGCSYSHTDTVTIRKAPKLQLTLDGSHTDTSFCANEDNILLGTTILDSGSSIDTTTFDYSGAGVTDSIFNPKRVFTGLGRDTTTTLYTKIIKDSSGCMGKGSIQVIIKALPSVDIDVAFNGSVSIYGSARDTAKHTYSRNTSAFPINSSPSYTSGLNGVITGLGVYLANGKYFYAPSIVPLNAVTDNVYYTYTDSAGCTNKDTTIIKIDSLPSFSATITFTNEDTLAPQHLFEACAGSKVSFEYDGLSKHPNKVKLTSNLGRAIPIAVNASNTSITNNKFRGKVTLTIPNNAVSGKVYFLNNTSLLDSTRYPLVIHSPIVDFLPQTTPLCATDTSLSLYGIPSGGTFTADTAKTDSTFINGSAINSTHAKWDTKHMNSLIVDVTYSYTPQYSNGQTCASSKDTTQAVTIYDNRLDRIDFATIVKQTNGNNDRLLTLDSRHQNNIITRIVPNIFCDSSSSSSCYSYTFSGNYVDQNNNFSGSLASVDTLNPVYLEFNNNGCIGKVDGAIRVTNFSKIYGLPDKLCSQSSYSDTLKRDPSLIYKAQVKRPSSSQTRQRPFIQVTNRLMSLTSDNDSLKITIINSAPNGERFYIKLNNPTTDTITVQALYLSYNADTSSLDSILRKNDSLLITHTITIDSALAPADLTGVPSYYCANDSLKTLQLSPTFINNNITKLSIYKNGNLVSPNSISSSNGNTTINPSTIYQNNASNQDLSLELKYQVDYYGCSSDASKMITIKAPLNPRFAGPSGILCKNTNNTVSYNIYPPLIPSGASGYFSPSRALDTSGSNYYFNTQNADVGNNPIKYTLKDNSLNCSYSHTETIRIAVPPKIELMLDSSLVTDTTLCSNDSPKIIGYKPISNNIDPRSISYFGNGVSDSVFTPSPILGSTVVYITATIMDLNSCIGADTIKVTIVSPPTPKLAFDTTYCKNDSSFSINASPSPSTGRPSSNKIIGRGVSKNNNIYYYNPNYSSSLTSINKDTVIYAYTDSIGCSASDTAIVQIDTVPIVQLNHSLDTSFCKNDPSIQLLATPNALGQGIYSGPGIDSSGLLQPSLANAVQDIIYEFKDNNNCTARDTIKVTVNRLPIPKFKLNKNQYCINDATDTLKSENDTTGYYKFYGTIITDTLGILQPSANNSTGTGTKTIYYTYTNSLGCSDTISKNVFIHPGQQIILSGLDSAYCSSSSDQSIGLYPNGGQFTTTDSNLFSIDMTGVVLLKPSSSTQGYKKFTYTYTDGNGCSDTLYARTYIHSPSQSTINNLDSFYCKVPDTIRLTGTPGGGTFSGPGIGKDSSWYFIPNKAGLGSNSIHYSINSIDSIPGQSNPLVCPIDTTVQVVISDLPTPKLASPTTNARFCSNDTLQELIPDSTINTKNYWHQFTRQAVYLKVDTVTVYDSTTSTVYWYRDSTYYFNPSVAGNGTHSITYTLTDSLGCKNSANFTFIVDGYTAPQFQLDTTYCESNDSIVLSGLPSGGVFTITQGTDTIRDSSTYFFPNSNRKDSISHQFIPMTSSIDYDIAYTHINNSCIATKKQTVTIKPIPRLHFTTDSSHNTYCLGGNPVSLITTSPGIFSGNGIRPSTNYFLPNLAGPGSHNITLKHTDTTTGCANSVSRILYVYSMPNVDFAIDGGCQFGNIRFKPKNDILGLINNSQVVDSITSIKWVMSPRDFIMDTTSSHTIDSVDYIYNTAGVYNTQLIVANRFHCIDTQTVRLVISPKVSSYPYEQDFETDAGGWFAESRDSSHRLLWEWGLDNNNRGIAADATNHIWATQTNASYNRGEDAWVYSPCFDISSLKRPMISLDYWSHTRGQGADGTVLEYQRVDGVWAPLGTVGRGTNWFNTPFIPGKPGDQFADDLIGTGWTAPLGWSGINTGWQNGRYKLDAFRGRQNTLRLRMAFASTNLPLNNFYDGFAFDNVIIRDRTRNVLLETMAHDAYSDMENINNHSYQLIHHTLLNKDVVLLQYHIESADGINTTGGSKDAFYLHNPSLGRTRAYEYNSSPAGRAFIDGLDSTYTTRNLSAVDFEQDMLATPKFSIAIDTFSHINGNFKIVARVKALQAMPTADYRIYTVISEDSLNYPNGSSYTSQIHAVVRENDQHHLDNSQNSPNIFHQHSWANDEVKRVEFNWNHTSNGFINYRPKPFQAIVFIQNITTKEIFQVASTRDVSGYWIDTTDISVDQVQVANELQEIQGMTLFPNPAHDYFHLKFEQALKQEYQWRLVDMRGVELQQGNVAAGTEQLLIEGLQHPPGTYILLLHNKHVFVQRKVILGRP